MKDLEKKVVLVTGAAKGIGKATAIEFAKNGSRLILVDIDEDGLKTTAEEIKKFGKEVMFVKTDVSDPKSVENLVNKSISKMGRVDVLANIAGILIMAEMKDCDLSDWQKIINVNLWGPIHTVHYLLPHMLKNGSGHIVNMSSGAGFIALPGSIVYGTSKYGVYGFSENLRIELAHYGIGVTVVGPGGVKTDMTQKLVGRGVFTVIDASKQRLMMPEQIAKKIVKAVKKNKFILMPGASMKAVYYVKRISQGFFNFGMKQLYKIIRKNAEKQSSKIK